MLPSSRVPAAAPDPDASTQLARAAARLLFAGALIAAMPAHAQDQADWDSDLDSLLGEPPSQDQPPRKNVLELPAVARQWAPE